MELVIKINLDNAAFEDVDEIDRVIGQAKQLYADWISVDSINLRDINGNKVGYAEITE